MPSKRKTGLGLSLTLRSGREGPTGAQAISQLDRVGDFISKGVYAAVGDVIRRRGDAIHARVSTLITGSQRTGVSRKKTGFSSSNRGLGIEIPPVGRTSNAVGQVTSRMKSGLSIHSVDTSDGHSSTVGWGQKYDPWNNLFARNAIDYTVGGPTETGKSTPNFIASSIQFDTLPTKYPDFLSTAEEPEVYVADVLLGSSEFTGRNVLRLALIEDIMANKTEDEVVHQIKVFFGSGEIANFRFRN